MRRRTFDEMISYFNQKVSDMDIDIKYKMELLGMITAIFQRHDEDVPHWIPVTERLPDVAQRVLLSGHGQVMVGMLHSFGKYSLEPTGISYVYPKDDIEAWMPLPEPYKEEA